MSRFTLLIAISLVAVPAAGSAQQTPTTSVTAPSDRAIVSFADLNIASAQGQRILKRRIAGAIEEVCGSFANAREWSEERRIKDCRGAAWESADRQLASRPASQRLALVFAR